MPEASRRWSTTIRVSSLGADGRILPHRVLELMQEAAASASTQAGYSPQRYREMGAGWVIREVRMCIDDTVEYGDLIEIETWISWIRRFRSRREYVARVGDRVVARGQAEWLFLERGGDAGFRPRIPDADMLEAFPKYEDVAIPAEEVLAFQEPAGEPLDTDERRVEPTEIDGNGHVNNVRYLAWLDDHGRHVRSEQSIVGARLEYLADARSRELLQLALYETDTVDLQFIRRGDQPVMRAAIRRRKVG